MQEFTQLETLVAKAKAILNYTDSTGLRKHWFKKALVEVRQTSDFQTLFHAAAGLDTIRQLISCEECSVSHDLLFAAQLDTERSKRTKQDMASLNGRLIFCSGVMLFGLLWASRTTLSLFTRGHC